jgi:hypothetical protein
MPVHTKDTAGPDRRLRTADGLMSSQVLRRDRHMQRLDWATSTRMRIDGSKPCSVSVNAPVIDAPSSAESRPESARLRLRLYPYGIHPFEFFQEGVDKDRLRKDRVTIEVSTFGSVQPVLGLHHRVTAARHYSREHTAHATVIVHNKYSFGRGTSHLAG